MSQSSPQSTRTSSVEEYVQSTIFGRRARTGYPGTPVIIPCIAAAGSRSNSQNPDPHAPGDGDGTEPKKSSTIYDQLTSKAEEEKSRKLYPERGGEPYKSSWWDTIWKFQGQEGLDKIKCERNVFNAITNSPLVKLMMSALKASGCPVDIRRHISCEACDQTVTGGYDPFLNQVVVCQNTARSVGMIQGVLTHEMIHMFDYCRHNLDLNNLRHLACTEIRAANLAHCSFTSAYIAGKASIFHVKSYHKWCVMDRAVRSVQAVKDIDYDDALEIVKEVFDKCYGDLEPIGRRIRRNSEHIQRAYEDRFSMGYE